MDSEVADTGLAKEFNDYRMLISSGEGEEMSPLSIQKKQWWFLRNFLNIGDFEEAARRTGVEPSTAAGWFRQPRFKQFLRERMRYAADKNGCTFDWSVSQLKDVWDGKAKRNRVQFECLKELNRMMGHVKENQGGINAREFINAEYVVIQKDSTINLGHQAPQISGDRGPVHSQISISPVREAMGEKHSSDFENVKGDSQASLHGLVSDQPAQAV